MWQVLQRKRQSLIFRLLLYFLLSMLALALVVAMSFANRIKPHLQHDILPNVERYIEYLINDIGLPPDLTKAQQLADSLPFELRIEGRGVSWSSNSKLGPIAGYRFEPAPPPYDNVYIGHHRHDEYLLIQRPSYQYLFVVDSSFRRGSERRHGVLFVLVGAILALLYFAIRRLFRPIGIISAQVEKIGDGDLEQCIEVKGKGELALLADGINRMAEQIKSMLEGKSGLLLAISHELRSPMTRMRVNLELLEDSPLRQKLIDDIREMETLVSAILESEKLSRGHAPLNLVRSNLPRLIDEVIAVHPCRERIKTHLAPADLDLDELRIKLLLKNLIDNACHYSSESQAPIDIILQCDRGDAVIEVVDRGSGIRGEEISRLTEAFFRPDGARRRETGGYGLGLYLCQLIATAHHGQLKIESEYGTGTKVIVRLPMDNS